MTLINQDIGIYEGEHLIDSYADVDASLVITRQKENTLHFDFRIHHYTNHGYFNVSSTGHTIELKKPTLLLSSSYCKRSPYEDVYKVDAR